PGESQGELRDDGGAREATEVRAELRSRARDVEGTEGIEVAPSFDVDLGRSLREEIERATKAPARPTCTASEDGTEASIVGHHAKDARRLEVVEPMQDDGLGEEQRHAVKLLRTRDFGLRTADCGL